MWDLTTTMKENKMKNMKKKVVAILLTSQLGACSFGAEMGTGQYWEQKEASVRHTNNTFADIAVLGKVKPKEDKEVIQAIISHRPHEPGILGSVVQSLTGAVDGAMKSLKRYVKPATIQPKKKVSQKQQGS